MRTTRCKLLSLFLCFLVTCSFATNEILHVSKDSIKHDPLDYQKLLPFNITKHFLFHNGDNIEWSKSSYNDANWTKYDNQFENTGWFRLRFKIDSTFESDPLCFILKTDGNFLFYLDDSLLINNDVDNAQSMHYPNYPIYANLSKGVTHCLAIKYTGIAEKYTHKGKEISIPKFGVELFYSNKLLWQTKESNYFLNSFSVTLTIFFLSIGFVHLLMYLFYRENKSNLYFFLFCLFTGFSFFAWNISMNDAELHLYSITSSYLQDCLSFIFIFMLTLTNSLFNKQISKKYTYFLALLLIVAILNIIFDISLITVLIIVIVSSFEIIRIVFFAVKNQEKGSKIIGTGVSLSIILIFTLIGIAITIGNIEVNEGVLGILLFLVITLCIISIPLSMSIFLAKDFAETNTNLKQRLIEVEQLSIKNIQQEQEKKKILESQKEKLEVQVAERTAELAEKNKDITDSIKYAKRIQEAMLPNLDAMLTHLPDSFVLYKPKDIISGDFYWFTEKNNLLFVAAADCTGHGVPGALMSMIGSTLLNEIINGKGIVKADDILFQLREGIIKSLKQTGADGESKDGMDISLCIINKANQSLEFAGANNPLWIIQIAETIGSKSDSKLIEIKGNKQPIGIYFGEAKPFTAHTIKYNAGDVIYLFTDGYADQFGGPKGKKFKYSQLQQLIIDNSLAPMHQQKVNLENTIKSWKGELEQIDDILVIGIKL